MPHGPGENFGKRRLPPLPAAGPPSKRSHHIGLLLMGTIAVGGGAYALSPSENCDPNRPAIAGQTAECQSRSSSSSHGGSGGSSSRSNFASTESASGHSPGSSSDGATSHVARGGFGSFAHSFGAHFSGG